MVAIGGINRDNFDDVLAEPVDGIAVISAITEMEDIEYETAMWIENMEWCKMFLEKWYTIHLDTNRFYPYNSIYT